MQPKQLEGTVAKRTFIAIQPDGVQRSVGLKCLKPKGFCLIAMKLIQAFEDLLKEQHYVHLKDRVFFAGLARCLQSGPVGARVWEGLKVLKTGHVMLRETSPADSKPGTIRGDFCTRAGGNIIHGCDSSEGAGKETGLWFGP